LDFKKQQVWFITGSQSLYGQKTLDQVAEHSRIIAEHLNGAPEIPVSVIFKPIVTTPESILQVCLDANASPECIGLVVWMHTFSPAKMWIAGLKTLRKPFAHLHTQFNRDLPWSTIDMDFMNLNQAAHGDREFGYGSTRLGLSRKVIVGFWQDADVLEDLARWARTACAWHDAQHMKVARFGDNMRQVAVTEGDKVEAQIRFGYSVNSYGVGDLVASTRDVVESEVDRLLEEYGATYDLASTLGPNGTQRSSLREAARIELGLRNFLEQTGSQAFTDTFEDLHGLAQLPGIAVQRLMNDGYGFGAEGDWKTAALVRSMKVMGSGLKGGTSFMEDYTYHLQGGGKVLGSHMLEVCPSIAGTKPRVVIHPLAIGGKSDPVRLVFTTATGAAVNASIVDLGNRFRMIVNTVDVTQPEAPLAKLPVASTLWAPRPNLKVAAAAWIYAGGAHHTAFSQSVSVEQLEDFASMAGIEFLLINEDTTVHAFNKELRWNEAYFHLKGSN